jgi:site-specific recombinase
VTTLTLAAKTLLSHFSLPLFFEGFLSFLNYSGSFLFMQFAHLTLATKQPSMTASALSGKLIEKDVRKDVDGFVSEVKQIVRSQFAAAVGNIGFVIPTSILFSFLFQAITKQELLHSQDAVKYLESFNPLTSGTIFFALITGVLLWTASVAGGWVENWFVYRKLGEAMTYSRNLKKIFGEERVEKIANWFAVNVGGLVTNVTLGFLLAFAPIAGKFFGLPIEVRHVTLSSGSLAFSVFQLGGIMVMKELVLFAVAGVLIIGILNFVSSFVLSMTVACIAREVKFQDVVFLMGSIGLEFFRRPFDFFRPPPK